MQSSLFLSCWCSLLLIITVNANRCPDPEDIRPCICGVFRNTPTTRCRNIFQLQVLKRIFNLIGDRPVVQLEISDSTMNFFPVSALKEKHMRALYINSSTLVSLFERDPEENFKFSELVLYKSNILRGIQWSQLYFLHNLTRLYINGVGMRSLGKDFVENIPTNLLEIDLFNTGITRLHDQAFSRLHLVKRIDMNYGKLTTLKRSMFATPNNLERLSFRGQKLSSLPDDIFSNMPKMKNVYFGENQITTVSEAVFKDFANRNVVVYLWPNPIRCSCAVQWAAGRSKWELHAVCTWPPGLQGAFVNQLGADWGCPAE